MPARNTLVKNRDACRVFRDLGPFAEQIWRLQVRRTQRPLWSGSDHDHLRVNPPARLRKRNLCPAAPGRIIVSCKKSPGPVSDKLQDQAGPRSTGRRRMYHPSLCQSSFPSSRSCGIFGCLGNIPVGNVWAPAAPGLFGSPHFPSPTCNPQQESYAEMPPYRSQRRRSKACMSWAARRSCTSP